MNKKIVVLLGISLLLTSYSEAKRKQAPSAHETMTYEAKIGPLTIGRIAIAIAEKWEKKDLSYLYARAKSEPLPVFYSFYSLKEELRTRISHDDFRPVFSTLIARKNDRLTITKTHHRHLKSQKTTQHIQTNKRSYKRNRKLGAHYDPLSAFLALRHFDLSQKRSLNFNILTGKKFFGIDARFKKKTRYYFQRSKRDSAVDVIVIEGVLSRLTDKKRPFPGKKRRHFTLYLSNDSRRIPVFATIDTPWGKLQAELTSHKLAFSPYQNAKSKRQPLARIARF